MKRLRHFSVQRMWSACLLACGLLAFLCLPARFRTYSAPPAQISPEDPVLSSTLYLPVITRGYVPPSGRLCRFGVGAEPDIGRYDVNGLRIGWYVDWTTTASPARPGGITYVPTVRLRQVGADAYTFWPDEATLKAAIAANPGALWLIGNEPDRRRWQDSLEPHVYAQAYHDLYYWIKAQDPRAKIGAGGIVQPTPLRLQYLDMVLEHYQQRYGNPMPVDVWNIHAFILRERSCDYYPEDCWGAEIPPGIDVPEGMLYDIQDNDNVDIFKEHIERFRRWMADRGYQDRPLIITEFGVQMWPDYGFPPERVNAYMNATFDYLMTATGPTGYPADGYRLVQRWAWYSLADDDFNGWLFDPQTGARTVFGDNFAAYTTRVEPTVNLVPVKIWVTPPSAEETTPYTLSVQVANAGHREAATPTTLHFYVNSQLASEQIVPVLDGCATSVVMMATWHPPAPGTYTVQVVVDPENRVAESNEEDNVLSTTVSTEK